MIGRDGDRELYSKSSERVDLVGLDINFVPCKECEICIGLIQLFINSVLLLFQSGSKELKIIFQSSTKSVQVRFNISEVLRIEYSLDTYDSYYVGGLPNDLRERFVLFYLFLP